MVCTLFGLNRSEFHLALVYRVILLISILRLAYNLSPSFNWKAAMEPKDQETYIKRLASLGYCWQFITLAGLHSTALISDRFAKAFSKSGMRAYGELIQEPEMEQGVEVVTHQKWSGANYADELLKMVSGGVSSTSAMGAGVTEDQFKVTKGDHGVRAVEKK
jgi:isocitrate lyase